ANPFDAAERKKARANDLFRFKAHFRGAQLPDGLMPLLSFDAGYGGMVRCEDGLVSLSCCIRRGRLERLQRQGNESAAEHVFAHIKRSCPRVVDVLAHATREGAWLAAGPLRPGIRAPYTHG